MTVKRQRTYRQSTRFSTYTEYEQETMDSIMMKIKKSGAIPKGRFISPNQIEPYLKELYFEILDLKKIDGGVNSSE